MGIHWRFIRSKLVERKIATYELHLRRDVGTDSGVVTIVTRTEAYIMFTVRYCIRRSRRKCFFSARAMRDAESPH